jgi:hypothetical protein
LAMPLSLLSEMRLEEPRSTITAAASAVRSPRCDRDRLMKCGVLPTLRTDGATYTYSANRICCTRFQQDRPVLKAERSRGLVRSIPQRPKSCEYSTIESGEVPAEPVVFISASLSQCIRRA